MTYTLTLHDADDTSPERRRAAERRFCQVLESTLGDASLVVPVYLAVQALTARHGEHPDPFALTEAEQSVLAQWQQAERAALEAVLGPHRHLDEAQYTLRPA